MLHFVIKIYQRQRCFNGISVSASLQLSGSLLQIPLKEFKDTDVKIMLCCYIVFMQVFFSFCDFDHRSSNILINAEKINTNPAAVLGSMTTTQPRGGLKIQR